MLVQEEKKMRPLKATVVSAPQHLVNVHAVPRHLATVVAAPRHLVTIVVAPRHLAEHNELREFLEAPIPGQ